MTPERRSGSRLATNLAGVLVVAGVPLRRVDGTVVEVSAGGCRLLPGSPVPDGARGILALRHGDDVHARPVRQVMAADGGAVRVVFDATAEGTGDDDWADLLDDLSPGAL